MKPANIEHPSLPDRQLADYAHFGLIDESVDMDRFIQIVRNVDVGCMLSRAELTHEPEQRPNFRRMRAPPAQRQLATRGGGTAGHSAPNDRAMKLSVIIANYNDRDFVGAAISSALGCRLAGQGGNRRRRRLDRRHKKSVIDGFRGKVAAYFRPKSYQLGAHASSTLTICRNLTSCWRSHRCGGRASPKFSTG
jgi:hypothetical protein